MSLREQQKVRDLLVQLPRLLEPRPKNLHFSICVRGDSNYHSFLKCINSTQEQSEANHPATVVQQLSNRQLFNKWVKRLTEVLPAQFINEHKRRLTLLSELYKLAYGGILEDLSAYDRLKVTKETELTDCIRSCLLRHAESDLQTRSLAVADITDVSIARIRNETFESGENKRDHVCFLLLHSTCEMHDGSTMHIPMLDFSISVNEKSLDIVSSAVEALLLSITGLDNSRGFILNSGQSYHFLGLRLITQQQLEHFLHRALLLVPLVDARYIGHSVLDGELCLRVSERLGRNDEPVIFRRIEESSSLTQVQSSAKVLH